MVFQQEYSEQNKPSCFGMPSCRSAGSDVCATCVYNSQCDESCIAILNNIHQSIDVELLIRKHEKLLAKARQNREPLHKNKIIVQNYEPSQKAELKDTVENVELEISDRDVRIINKLSDREKQVAIKLCKNGLIERIKSEIRFKRNALHGFEIKWLDYALQALIDDEYDAKLLIKRFMSDLNVSEKTAVNYIHSSAVIFLKFKIAVNTEISHVIKVNPLILGGNYEQC